MVLTQLICLVGISVSLYAVSVESKLGSDPSLCALRSFVVIDLAMYLTFFYQRAWMRHTVSRGLLFKNIHIVLRTPRIALRNPPRWPSPRHQQRSRGRALLRGRRDSAGFGIHTSTISGDFGSLGLCRRNDGRHVPRIRTSLFVFHQTRRRAHSTRRFFDTFFMTYVSYVLQCTDATCYCSDWQSTSS